MTDQNETPEQAPVCPYCGDGLCTLCLQDIASKEFENSKRKTITVNMEITPAAKTAIIRMFNPELYQYFADNDKLN
jgi:hypothetical protein